MVPNCAEAGVLGVLPGVLGALQATEAIKLMLGIGAPLVGRLLTYDALAMEWREFRFARRADCAVCGAQPTITSLVGHAAGRAAPASGDFARLGPAGAAGAAGARRPRRPGRHAGGCARAAEFAAGHLADRSIFRSANCRDAVRNCR